MASWSIFNTDQGSHSTGVREIEVLSDGTIQISVDFKDRWIDNRIRERLWRLLKCECVYLQAFEAQV